MKTVSYILIIAIITLPGVYVQGELINFIDVIIPTVFLYYALKKKNIKVNKYIIPLALYIIICFISIIFVSLKSNVLYIEAFMKWLRLLNMLLLSIVAAIVSENLVNNIDSFLVNIINFGTISGIIGIILFFLQSPLYRPPQTFIFNNKVIYRAGGIFAEPLTFALMMAIVFSTSLRCVMNRRHIIKASIAIVVSCLSIVFSDSRTGIIAIIIIIIRLFLPQKMMSKQYMFILSILTSLIIIVLVNNDYMRNVFSRVISSLSKIATGNFIIVDSALSGRLSVWLARLKDFSNSSFIQLLFGRGYKVNSAISDNSFVSALYYTGFAGLIAFIAYVITLVKTAFSRFVCIEDAVIREIYKDVVIILLIFMLSSDVITLNRPMYLVALFSIIIIYGRTNIYKKENSSV